VSPMRAVLMSAIVIVFLTMIFLFMAFSSRFLRGCRQYPDPVRHDCSGGNSHVVVSKGEFERSACSSAARANEFG